MIHDIAVTPDYYVVVAGPVNFDAAKFVTQYFTSRCSIAECLVYDPAVATKVHLVPRLKGAAGAWHAIFCVCVRMMLVHCCMAPAQRQYNLQFPRLKRV
jgi:hypothetical protein